MRFRAPTIAVVLLAALAVPAAEPGSGGNTPGGKRPLRSLPYTPSLDVSSMDRSVDPCVDLYAYSCGGWMKANPIPPDQARWTVYGKLQDENQQYLWGILDAVAAPDPLRSPVHAKIGDYFASCMDEEAIEGAGTAPIESYLRAMAALRSKEELAGLLARLHLATGSGAPFGFGADQDPKNSEQVIAFALAGGLGLPDRDYYLKKDAKSRETRSRYEAHVRKMLAMSGDAPEAAARGAQAVLRIETALAKGSLTRVERRDPYKIYHKMKVEDLQARTPSFRWSDYLAGLGGSGIVELNVTEPRFFGALEKRIRKESLADWKSYLRWHLVTEWAPYLSSAFVKEDFEFYRAYLRGVKEMQPRWKRCVSWTDRDLGEALGQVFVEKTFPPEIKERTLEMVRRIESAMEVRIRGLGWMTEPTRKQAISKLVSVRNKIGYPDTWRDYGKLEVRRGDLAGNAARAAEFEFRRQLTKIGKPVDRNEWGMTPPTVNAYYNSSMNDINFPAGVLLPPLFDPRLDDAPNYGNTGGTIGHELIHGFDDEGRQFDAKGNLSDWWTAADAAEFEKRASCIADQYAQYTVVDDIKINSRLTLGEDAADLGGLILAYEAWKAAAAGQVLEPADGLTPDRRFFVGFAQWACENDRDENRRISALTNPHSPGIYRINGVVANMKEFREAFACAPGKPLVREPVCSVW
jgi:endothelin-converting enzyme/putative endopeptidase